MNENSKNVQMSYHTMLTKVKVNVCICPVIRSAPKCMGSSLAHATPFHEVSIYIVLLTNIQTNPAEITTSLDEVIKHAQCHNILSYVLWDNLWWHIELIKIQQDTEAANLTPNTYNSSVQTIYQKSCDILWKGTLSMEALFLYYILF